MGKIDKPDTLHILQMQSLQQHGRNPVLDELISCCVKNCLILRIMGLSGSFLLKVFIISFHYEYFTEVI